MEILRVESPLVCTRRIEGLRQVSLRVLRDASGRRQVAGCQRFSARITHSG